MFDKQVIRDKIVNIIKKKERYQIRSCHKGIQQSITAKANLNAEFRNSEHCIYNYPEYWRDFEGFQHYPFRPFLLYRLLPKQTGRGKSLQEHWLDLARTTIKNDNNRKIEAFLAS